VIAILDYGAGNMRSVTNALSVFGARYQIVRDAPGLLRAEKIILPGVGHFGQMMRALDALQIRDALMERIHADVPFLGICLGLHALFDGSEEAPGVAGLSLVPGGVKRFPSDKRVPHMGWNQIQLAEPVHSRLLRGVPGNPYVYFAHSYYAPVESNTSASCEYRGVRFTAAFERDNISAIQFHPEKSGTIGRRILQNFAGL
jgi:imidazole glycerol-phosphate synthase subunit HisH